jgi:hypothetical protein
MKVITQEERYKAGLASGAIDACYQVARSLGEKFPGPSYLWEREFIRIHVDDVAGWMTVTDGDMVVCSTHARVFIAGMWMASIWIHIAALEAIRAAAKESYQSDQRTDDWG